MSTFVDVVARCRSCDRDHRVSVAAGINVARTPAARDQILAGTFQRWPCAGCGEGVTALRPFSYVDFDREQMFGVLPLALEERWWEWEGQIQDTFRTTLGDDAPRAYDSIPDEIFLRTVFGLEALREKLIVLEAGLDDGVVEVLKLQHLLATGAVEATPALRVDAIADEVLLLRSGREVFGVPMAEYADLASDVGATAPFLEVLRRGTYRDLGRLLASPAH